MHFFKVIALLPALAWAVPNAEPVAAVEARNALPRDADLVARHAMLMDLMERDLQERQDLGSLLNSFNLSGLISNLGGILGGVTELLSPESLRNIDTLITSGAQLLNSNNTAVISDLIGTVASLLTPELLQSIQGLLSPENIDSIQGLLSNILNGDLIQQVEGLLNAGTVSDLRSIVSNAADLLTEQFVSQTKGLIGDVAPLVSAVTQIISVLISSILGLAQ